jgi:hypothetical protein
MSDSRSYSRDEETEAERLDRNFNEQLQEVRIAQAGVQILFAFLLTIPFQQRFTTLSDLQRDIYLVTLNAMAISVFVFMAPVAMHRMLFRARLKNYVVTQTDRLIATGLVFLAIGIIGGVVLVLDVMLSHTTALWVGGALTVLAVALWVVFPVTQHRRRATDTD